MGSVWLVHDHERGHPVALKRLLEPSPQARMRMKREFRAVERLRHPALVRLYEMGEDAQGLYFTMACVDGVDLLEYCRTPGGRADTASSSRASRGVGGMSESQVSSARGTPSRAETAPSGVRTPADPHAPTLASEVGDVGAGTDDAPGRPATAATLDAPPDHDPGEPMGVPSSIAPGEASLSRLAHVLPQLLEALSFLHANGIVHRDLKPPNVLVRRDGTVQLLDFGILAELGQHGGPEDTVGTPGYMAPEQVQGKPATPAVDYYALGAMLFEVVAGRLPFEGTTMQVVYRTIDEPAPPLDELVPDAPRPLVEACAALLAKDPDARPHADVLARTLLPALGARSPIAARPRPASVELIGRDAERAALEAALPGAGDAPFALAAVVGPTGAGKSALVGAAAEAATAGGALVLRGRGRPQDRVPFNAVDAAVDGLAQHLAGRRRSRLDPGLLHDLSVASRAFPVLQRITGEPTEQVPAHRRAAFGALCNALTRIADEGAGVVLLIDDLQWADDDSIALLQHVTEQRPRGVGMLATLRDDVAATPGSRWVDGLAHLTRVDLAPLDDATIEEIVRQRCEAAGAPAPPPEVLHRAAEACGGRPFLAEVSAHALVEARDEASGGHGSVTDDSADPLHRLLRSVDAAHHPVLAALVAADGWARVGQLADVVGGITGEVDDALDVLERKGLVRRAGTTGGQGLADLFHDAVRQRAMEMVTGEAIRVAHGRFADLLADDPNAPVHRRVRHLLGGGRPLEAAEHARTAAAEAQAQQAHGLAAEMYAIALEHPDADRADLLRRRADALEQAARYDAAAACWRQRAEESTGEARVDALLGETHSLLAAGRIRDGHERLAAALAARGERGGARGGMRGLIAGIRFLRGPGRGARRAGDDRDTVALHLRAERDAQVGWMLGYFDPLAGLRFLQRALAGFERAGDDEQAAWCHYVFAQFLYFGDPRRRRLPMAERYIRAAGDALGDRAPESPRVRAMPVFLGGYDRMRRGRLEEAATEMRRAADLLEEGGLEGTFEHGTALTVAANAIAALQRLDALEPACRRLRLMERDVPDSAFRCHVAFADAILLTMQGRAAEGLRRVDGVAAEWPDDPPTIQRFLFPLHRAIPLLALARPAEARDGLIDGIRRNRRYRPLHTAYGPFAAATLAIADARALRAGDSHASLRRIRKHARLAIDGVPMWTNAAHRALAYASDARGDRPAALAHLERAEAAARRWDHRLDLQIARYQRGRRLPAPEGPRLMADAREAFLSEGADPALLDEDPGHA